MTTATESPEQLEQQIARTRAEIDVTLDAIQEKLSPGRLLDQVMDYTKENGGAFAGNLGRSVRDNPVPVALLGIGLGWLMFAGGRPRHDDGLSYAGEMDLIPGQGDAATGQAGAAGESIGHQVSGMADAGKAKARQLAGDARQLAEAAGDGISAARQRTYESAGRIKDSTHRAREAAGHFIEENPLVVGALALAAGAAFGALLPSTRREDEMMGATAERFRDVAGAKAREAAEAVKHAAETAAESGNEGRVVQSPEPAKDRPSATKSERKTVLPDGVDATSSSIAKDHDQRV